MPSGHGPTPGPGAPQSDKLHTNMIRKLAHLCLVTDNLDRMVAFYTTQIGLPIKFTFRNADDEVFGHYLACGDSTFIEIFDRVLKHKQWGGQRELAPLTYGTQKDHFCFEVTGLRELKADMESRGMKVSEIHTGMDQSLQAWTSAPDGNAVELMEYTHASWQLK